MMKCKYGYAIFLCLLVIGMHSIAYAAAPVVWDVELDRMVEIVKTTARALVAISIAITGLMVLFGFDDRPQKTIIYTILSVGIVLQIADFITGNHSQFEALRQIMMGGAVAKPEMPILSFSGPDKGAYFLRDFMRYGQNLCVYGAAMLVPYALKLLGGLAVIEVTMEMVLKMQTDLIRYLLHTILKIGFFIFLIQNWLGGTENIAGTIFNSFEQLGIIAAGGVEVKADQVLVQGFEVVRFLSETTMSASNMNVLLMVVGIVIELGIFACIIITFLQYMVTQMEFWFIAMIMVPFLPLGISKHTRYFFEVVVGAIFNLGIKMCVVSFIFTVVSPVITSMVYQLDHSWVPSAWGSNIILLLVIFIGLFLFATMSIQLPKLASVALYGKPALTAGDLRTTLQAAEQAVNISRKIVGTIIQGSYIPGSNSGLTEAQSDVGTGQKKSLKNLSILAGTSYNSNRSTRENYQEEQSETKQRMTWEPVTNKNPTNPIKGGRSENISANSAKAKNMEGTSKEDKKKK